MQNKKGRVFNIDFLTRRGSQSRKFGNSNRNTTPAIISLKKPGSSLPKPPGHHEFRIVDLAPNLRGLVHKKFKIKILPEDKIERCGYMWLSSDWLFGMFGKRDPMKEACVLHDKLFDKPDGLTRKEVDEIFYNAMTALIKERGGKWWMYVQRDVYYGIVRSLGWLAW